MPQQTSSSADNNPTNQTPAAQPAETVADWSLSRASAHAPGAPLVTIIGDGQLARMMHQAGIELGLTTRVLAGAADSSTAQVTPDVVLGDYTNRAHVEEVSRGSDAVTFDHEHVPNEFLEALIAEGINVQPQPKALVNAQDKLVMRKRMREIGAPVPPFMEITSAMVARTPSGEVRTWPVVESVQEDGICVEAVAPAPDTSASILTAAEELARVVASELEVTGVLAVELFETVDEAGQPEIIVNELAMRPHNTGHWTQDGCVTSQFEQHLRAVLDRPLGDTSPIGPTTVMANVLGADTDPDMAMHRRMDEVWRRYPNAKIHMYGKDWRPRRKMGHVNMVRTEGQSVDELRTAAREAANYLVTAQWTDGYTG